MNNKFLSLFLLYMTTSSAYADFSLFFQPQPSTRPHISAENLCLNAIVYTDDTHWTLWLNGQMIRPDTALEGFSIEHVTPDQVTLSLQGSEGREGEIITLRPQLSH